MVAHAPAPDFALPVRDVVAPRAHPARGLPRRAALAGRGRRRRARSRRPTRHRSRTGASRRCPRASCSACTWRARSRSGARAPARRADGEPRSAPPADRDALLRAFADQRRGGHRRAARPHAGSADVRSPAGPRARTRAGGRASPRRAGRGAARRRVRRACADRPQRRGAHRTRAGRRAEPSCKEKPGDVHCTRAREARGPERAATRSASPGSSPTRP